MSKLEELQTILKELNSDLIVVKDRRDDALHCGDGEQFSLLFSDVTELEGDIREIEDLIEKENS
jgi:hypothetical protein